MDGQLIHADSDATVVLSLEEMIKSNTASIQTLSEEKKRVSEMLEDTFNNDATYASQKDFIKQEQKKLKEIKSRISAQVSVKEMLDKKKHITSEIKERRNAVSDYLLEYERISEATQLELFPGEILQIVKVAKLVRTG